MDGENEAQRIEVPARGHDGSLSLDALNLSWPLRLSLDQQMQPK